jgi:hypothetical protein
MPAALLWNVATLTEPADSWLCGFMMAANIKTPFRAAFKGDAQAVAAWLDKGGVVDARFAESSTTLLMTAAAGEGRRRLSELQ